MKRWANKVPKFGREGLAELAALCRLQGYQKVSIACDAKGNCRGLRVGYSGKCFQQVPFAYLRKVVVVILFAFLSSFAQFRFLKSLHVFKVGVVRRCVEEHITNPDHV